MTRHEIEDRIAFLENQNNSAPYWGASIAARGEEIRELKRELYVPQKGGTDE